MGKTNYQTANKRLVLLSSLCTLEVHDIYKQSGLSLTLGYILTYCFIASVVLNLSFKISKT